MTHIETNMENNKNNALLYIEHNYNRTYNYYRSIAETILNLLFGTPYSTGTVDWGKHSPITLGLILDDSSLESTIWYPSGIFVDCKASVSAPYSTSIT